MGALSIGQILFYAAFLMAAGYPLGMYMARVYAGEGVVTPPVARVPRARLLPVIRIDTTHEQDWKSYATSVVVFTIVFSRFNYAVFRLQGQLFLNPDDLPGVPTHISLNTTASFVTNTNWQYYGGEYTMSYLSQMALLAVQQFVSAAVGMAVLVAVIRGFSRRSTKELGNFWRDLYRSAVYILLPLTLILAILLISQGVPQTFSGAASATTLEGANQMIARGPVASMIAIKQLGTNGGGFYNSNSAVPFENPNGLTNFLEMTAILLIPVAQVFMFGTDDPPAPPGDGDRGGDVRALRRRDRGDHTARAARVAGAPGLGRRSRRLGRARAAATCRTRRCASESRTPPSGPRRRRTPRTARSAAGTTR